MNFEYLKNELAAKGIDEVGYSCINGITEGYLENFKYGISIVVRLSDAVLNEITDKPTFTYFHHYRTVNSFIDQTTLWITKNIMKEGYYAFAVPASQTVNLPGKPYSGVFPHKTAAVMANLGWIGKNGLFISRVNGPRVRLGTILTDMPVPAPFVDTMKSQCGSCQECVEACPAMALHGVEWEKGMKREMILDPRACSEYMNNYFKHIGRGSVCGLCMTVCPYGKIKR